MRVWLWMIIKTQNNNNKGKCECKLMYYNQGIHIWCIISNLKQWTTKELLFLIIILCLYILLNIIITYFNFLVCFKNLIVMIDVYCFGLLWFYDYPDIT